MNSEIASNELSDNNSETNNGRTKRGRSLASLSSNSSHRSLGKKSSKILKPTLTNTEMASERESEHLNITSMELNEIMDPHRQTNDGNQHDGNHRQQLRRR